MEKNDVYALLEDKFLTYKELKAIPVLENHEKMMSLSGTSIAFLNIDPRMEKYTGQDIFVRESLVPRLQEAQRLLKERMNGATLQVCYGYRHLAIQTEIYEQYRQKVIQSAGSVLAEDEIKERTHHFIAVPEVSGHPTGGAVDVRLLDASGVIIDMGTDIHAFEEDSYVFSPFVSRSAWSNRQRLRECMVAAGFSPFDGEWWHFSYGDREWAAYYKIEAAIYEQLNFTAV